MFVTGAIMAVAQLFIFPPIIKILGAVKWMRIGSLLGITTFLAIPNVTFFSWNYSALFAMSVAGVTVINCCLAAVSALKLECVFPRRRPWLVPRASWVHVRTIYRTAGETYPTQRC